MGETLRLEGVSLTYQAENGEIEALCGLSLAVREGELLAIVGPSGCGKSTLLSVVAGLMPPTAGTVILGGQRQSGLSPQIGYMLQKDNLLAWRTVRSNVLLGLELRGQLSPERVAAVDALLSTYGLAAFQDKYPSQLSGGMRQRAALIRTLAPGPRVLLLDEAFSALDYQTRLSVTDDVHGILKSEGQTALMVTHDIPEAISMADRVAVLSARPARVREVVDITFGAEPLPPLARRNEPAFGRYFNKIWRELDA